MLKRNEQNFPQLKLLTSIISSSIIIKKLYLSITILCITGCYTILTPPPDYYHQEENLSIHEEVDSTIVTHKNINNYYCSNCAVYENSCSSIHWRYNSWSGTYYCDPYYYNYSYYNHHYYDHYWWDSHNNWNYHNYSDNYSYTRSKKTRRNRSFSRLSYDTVVENTNSNITSSSPSESNNYNLPIDNSNNENIGNAETSNDSQTKNSNVKSRRKHNRKPLWTKSIFS